MMNRRDHLVDTASRLFNAHGFHATGIDLILAESGVSKATLYKHFRSKEALIIEVLNRRRADFAAWLQGFVDARIARKYRNQPTGPIMALFDGLDSWLRAENFYGCSFINASAEYGDPSDPIHATAKAYKMDLRNYIEVLLRRCGYTRTRELSQQLLFLLDGAAVSAHTQSNVKAGRQAKRAAQLLLSAAGA